MASRKTSKTAETLKARERARAAKRAAAAMSAHLAAERERRSAAARRRVLEARARAAKLGRMSSGRYEINGEPMEGTLTDFFRDNVDAFSEKEKAIMRLLEPGQSFTGGGGGWAEFTLKRVR